MKDKFFMESNRLEAFSDGVLAVIITIMVLDLRPPHSTDVEALLQVVPAFIVYALSFVFIGIYWNNHHHMLRATRGIDARAMWANLHLLFWLSLVPFTTAWLGENRTGTAPTALYGIVLLLCAIAYSILQKSLLAVNGADAPFAQAIKVDVKGGVSLLLYVAAIAFAFISTVVSDILFFAIALWWLIPDRRFEPVIAAKGRNYGQ